VYLSKFVIVTIDKCLNLIYGWYPVRGKAMLSAKRLSGRAAAAIVVASLALPMSAFAGFFPADRPTFTCSTPTTCRGAVHVTFDSFTNNPVVGDERPFFSGKNDAVSGDVQDLVNVKNGDTVTLRAYVHNNADPNIISPAAATAHNVMIRVIVPQASRQTLNLVAFISADNANPGTINDTMNVQGDGNVTLAYVPGSATFTHKPDGHNLVTDKLNDSIVTTGAPLGDIKGCFEYSGYVTLKVKASIPGQGQVTPPAPPSPATPAPAPAPAPAPTPAPQPLPATGPETLALGGAAGTTALGYAVTAYRRSRRALQDSLKRR
jgi:hypothetical protein